MSKIKLTQAVLAAAAANLNEVIGIDPPIVTTSSRSELKAKVLEASELVEPADDLAKETREVLEALAEEAGGGEEEPAKPSRGKSNGNGEAKTDDKDKAGTTKKKTGTSKKKTAAKKDKKPAYTKGHALRDALKSGGTRQEITDKVDELYVKNGGKSSPSGSKAMVDIHLPVLLVFGVVAKDGDNFKLTK